VARFFHSLLSRPSDNALEPLSQYAQQPTGSKYPRTLAGDQVNEELRMIKLASPTNV